MPAASRLHRAAANGAPPHANGNLDAPLLDDPQLHDALLGDPAKLTEPIKRVEDKYQLLPAFLKVCRRQTLMVQMQYTQAPVSFRTSSCFQPCRCGPSGGRA
jgi:hypothetical protein